MTERKRRTGLASCLWAGAALLATGGAYLAAGGDPDPLYLANVLFHPLLGLVLLFPFVAWWWARRRQPLVTPGGLLLLGSLAAGLALMVFGNRNLLRPVLWAHAGLGTAGLVALLLAFQPQRRTLLFRAWTLGFLVAILVPAALILGERGSGPGRRPFANPASLYDSATGAMASRPFDPSAASTRDGRRMPTEVFTGSQSCGRSGCHPDIAAQWASSSHRASGLDNPWYRAAFANTREKAGTASARWCGGCHTPALLLSGALELPTVEVAGRSAEDAGVSCTACHAVTRVKSSIGQADYEMGIPPLHALAASRGRTGKWLHDLLVRLDPEPHRRTYAKPVLAMPELCSTCHKSHVEGSLNGDGWLQSFDDYSPWQVSSDTVQSGMRFLFEKRDCSACHMPRVASRDAGSRDGWVHSHRFAATNTALPALHGDTAQLKAVGAFLQDRMGLDIFAMTLGGAPGQTKESLAPLAEEVYAPLDRPPAAVRRGDSTRIDVVVRSRGVGHPFPAGKSDLSEFWLELKAVDDHGRTVFWSGRAEPAGPVDPGAHFFRTVWTDGAGRRVERHEVWSARALVYQRLIEPDAAHVVRFRFDVPDEVGGAITLTARLNCRPVSWDFTQWVFSRLGGQAPPVPIVVMAEDAVTLRVLDRNAKLPDRGQSAVQTKSDRERWEDYGLGLALQGDYQRAREALRHVHLQDDPDLLVNRALYSNSFAEVVASLEQAYKLDPKRPRTSLFLGLAEREQGRYGRAAEHLRAAAASHPDDPEIRRDLGNVLMVQGNFPGARDAFRELLAIKPEDAGAHLVLRKIYLALKDPRRAEASLRQYSRFKEDSAAPEHVRRYLANHSEDEHERQGIHEHRSIPLQDFGSLGLR
ncbi:MAG TPA: tetratricopeptide repeat protein [Thermoanaerobaculia bacterium]|nr:tetratricopeptide repeat protein [Thermoanaerobaculia bacterium]